MKIAALQFDENQVRVSFWKNKSVELINPQDIALSGVDVLFIHTTDFSKLDAGNRQKIIDFKGWKIRYTGNLNVTVNVDATKKEVNELTWDTIDNNYERFIQEIEQGKTNLEAIYKMIGYDPELERLLEIFSATNPFAVVDSYQNSLKEAKIKLQAHVESYLKSQGQ